MWREVRTSADAHKKIEEQIAAEGIEEPSNLEKQTLSLVGRDIFEKLVKGYTEKQWGRNCSELPKSLFKRSLVDSPMTTITLTIAIRASQSADTQK